MKKDETWRWDDAWKDREQADKKEDHELHQQREDNGRYYCIGCCAQCKKNGLVRGL